MTPRLFSPATSERPDTSAGFSLIELLVVMAILAVLIGLGAVAVRNSGANSARAAAQNLLGILENARMQAVAGNTHTRVAFAELPSNHPDQPGLGVITLISNTGTNSANETEWRESGRPTAFRGIGLGDSVVAGSQSMRQNDLPTVSRRAWGGNVAFSDGVLFTPSGAAYVSAGGRVDRLLSAAVVRLSGPEPPAEIALYTLSGHVALISP